MEDRELWQRARKAARLDARAKALAAEASSLKSEVRAELEEREVKGLTHRSGAQITYVAPESVVYNQRKLKRSLGPLWERCLEPTFSVERLAGLVQEGLVPSNKLARCSDVVAQTPYVRITIPHQDADATS